MKKIFMSIMAIAAMALAMTSCNKEEVVNGSDIYGTFLNADDLNAAKVHFVGYQLFWDENDEVIVSDCNDKAGYYHGVLQDDGSIRLIFDRASSSYNENNGPLTAYYPTTNTLMGHVNIPATQLTVAGEASNLPLYGEGTVDNFHWVCPAVCFALNVRDESNSGITLDSVSLTTDQYINGYFKVDLTNTNILTYESKGTPNRGHGSKTNTVSFASPLEITSTPHEVCIVLPAGTYNKFDLTFYSNGNKYVKRLVNPMTFTASLTTIPFSTASINLATATFAPEVKGAINAQYNIAGDGETPQYVMFAQGNVELIGRVNYWRFADNQWDFRGVGQSEAKNSNLDRDLFSWGANGNGGVSAWGVYKDYNFCTGTTLGTNDWGVKNFRNAVNGWRTLTETEMQNILTNHQHRMVTLSFVGKTGMVIFPDGVTPCDANATLTKADWNALEAAGCVFFAAEKYRTVTYSPTTGKASFYVTGNMSYFWLNTAATNTASALVIDATGYSFATTVDKKFGAFVRLVKDVE